jgi:hypothetical protein
MKSKAPIEKPKEPKPYTFRISGNPDLKKKFDKAVKKVGATKVIISALEKHLA